MSLQHDSEPEGTRAAGIPELVEGLLLPPEPEEAGGGVVFVPPDGYFRVTPMALRLLQLVDGRRDLEKLAEAFSAEFGAPVSAAEVDTVLRRTLAPRGLVHYGDAFAPARAVKRRSTLRGRMPILPASVVRRLACPLAPLFLPRVRGALVAAALAALPLSLLHPPVWLAGTRWLDATLWLPALGIYLASIAIHELGHAAAVLAGGREPGRIGFAFRGGLPVFYAEVDASWLLSRTARAVVDAGGVGLQLLLATLLLAGSYRFGPVPFLAAFFIYIAGLQDLHLRRPGDGRWLWNDLPSARARTVYRAVLLAWCGTLLVLLGPVLGPGLLHEFSELLQGVGAPQQEAGMGLWNALASLVLGGLFLASASWIILRVAFAALRPPPLPPASTCD